MTKNKKKTAKKAKTSVRNTKGNKKKRRKHKVEIIDATQVSQKNNIKTNIDFPEQLSGESWPAELQTGGIEKPDEEDNSNP